MTAPLWITKPGFLGTITERTAVNIAFTASGVNTIFSVIAGDLPSGLVLKKETTSTSVQIPNPNTGVISTQTGTLAYIVGNATSVPTTLASEFVIRATNASGVSDRTFIMNVIGGVDPTWITPAGFLPVGTSGEYFTVKGFCEGIIANEPIGTNGFGYDPIFLIPKYKKTFGQLGLKAKDRMSHRSKALKRARKFLREYIS